MNTALSHRMFCLIKTLSDNAVFIDENLPGIASLNDLLNFTGIPSSLVLKHLQPPENNSFDGFSFMHFIDFFS